MRSRVVFALASVLVGTVCSANDSAVEVALQARWTAAYNSGDATALAAMYAADARLQSGYCPAIAGRAAIEKFWRDDLVEGTTTTQLEIHDALAFEGALYVSGKYAVDIAATPAVEARRVGGTYTQIWLHEEGRGWTIHRETWGSLACADIVVKPPQPERESASMLETASTSI